MTTRAKNTASIVFGWVLMTLATIFLTLKFLYADKYAMNDIVISLIFSIGVVFAMPKSRLAQIIVGIFKRKSDTI